MGEVDDIGLKVMLILYILAYHKFLYLYWQLRWLQMRVDRVSSLQ